MAILFPVDQCDLQKVPVLFYSPALCRIMAHKDSATTLQVQSTNPPSDARIPSFHPGPYLEAHVLSAHQQQAGVGVGSRW